MNADDIRKTVDSLFDKLTPAKAQEVARGLVGEERREQASKLAGDLIETAQRNRDRVKELAAREVKSQLKTMGLATQSDLDAVKKRVRDLERATKGSAAKPTAAKASAAKGSRKTASAKTPAAKKRTSA